MSMDDRASRYRYAAACLASDHAEQRLRNALAAFVQSLQEPTTGRAPLATALSGRLAQLRQGASESGDTERTASGDRGNDPAEIRQAA